MTPAQIQASVKACDIAHEARARTTRICDRIYPLPRAWSLTVADPFAHMAGRRALAKAVYPRIAAKIKERQQ